MLLSQRTVLLLLLEVVLDLNDVAVVLLRLLVVLGLIFPLRLLQDWLGQLVYLPGLTLDRVEVVKL